MAVAPVLFQPQSNNASGQAIVFLALQNHHWVKCQARKVHKLPAWTCVRVREAPGGLDHPVAHNFSSDYRTAQRHNQ